MMFAVAEMPKMIHQTACLNSDVVAEVALRVLLSSQCSRPSM